MDNEILIKLNVESSSASQKIKSLNSYLKQLDSQLKLGATGFQNYNQKLKSMSKSVDLTQQKLNGLKTKLDVQNQQLDKASTRYKKLQTELNNVANTLGKNSQEYQELAQKVAQAQRTEQKYQSDVNRTTLEIKKESQALVELKGNLAALPYENLSAGLKKISSGFGKVSEMTKPLSVALTGAFGAAIKTSIDFESAMAEVGAITNATTGDMQALEEQARKIGETTQLSATQGAESLKLLAQAGYNVSDSIKLSTDTVNLAIASNLELGEATTILVSTLKGFQLGIEESTRVTDVLSKTANSSNTNVSELGSAMTKVAPTAQAMGYKIEDVSVILGLLANNAIVGEEAGNGLKSMLASLAKPTDNAKGLMEKLGVSLVDTNGNSRSLIDVFKDLRNGFAELDETQQAEYAATIVGKEQMSKFLAIVNSGEDDFNGLINAIAQCDGTTARMRETMENTTSGSIKSMLSKLQEMAISIGQKLLPHVVKFVEGISKLVDKFNSLDSATQDNIIKLGLFAAGISPVSNGLSKLFDGASRVSDGFGKFSKWLAQGGAELDNVSSKSNTTAQATSSLGKAFSSIGDSVSGSVIPAFKTFGGMLGGLALTIGGGIGIGILTAEIAGAIDVIKQMGNETQSVAEKYNFFGDIMQEVNDNELNRIKQELPEITARVDEFKQKGLISLIEGTKNLNENGSADFTAFLDICKQSMEETISISSAHTDDFVSRLSEWQNKTTGSMTFTMEQLAKIQEDGKSKVSGKMAELYGDLETTVQNRESEITRLMEDEGLTRPEAASRWFSDYLEKVNTFYEEQKQIQAQANAEMLEQARINEAMMLSDKDATYKKLQEYYEEDKNQSKNKLMEKIADANRLNMEYGENLKAETGLTYEQLLEQAKGYYAQDLIENEISNQKRLVQAGVVEADIGNKRITLMEESMAKVGQIIENASVDDTYARKLEAINAATEQGLPLVVSTTDGYLNEVFKCYETNGGNMENAVREATNNLSNQFKNTNEDIRQSAQETFPDVAEAVNSLPTGWNDASLQYDQASQKIIDDNNKLQESSNSVTQPFVENQTLMGTSIDDLNNKEFKLGENYLRDLENFPEGETIVSGALNKFSQKMLETEQTSSTTSTGIGINYDALKRNIETSTDANVQRFDLFKGASTFLQQALTGDFGLINGAVTGTAGIFGTNFGAINTNYNELGNQSTTTTDELLTNNTKLNKSSGETASAYNKNLSSMDKQSGSTARTTSTNAGTMENSLGRIGQSSGNMSSDAIRSFMSFIAAIINTASTTGSKSGDIKSSLGGIQNQAGTSMSGAVGSFNQMKSGIIATGSTVATQAQIMVSRIKQIKGKNERVTVNFLANGFEGVMSKIRSAVRAATNAIANVGKDGSVFTSEIRPIGNIGLFSTEGGYTPFSLRTGLKDFDAVSTKTLSLKSYASNPISAYATGDTFAADYLGSIKQGSYSSTDNDILNKTLLGLIAQLNTSKEEKPVEVNLHIENFNGTQQNIDQLMRELNSLIQRSKKRF